MACSGQPVAIVRATREHDPRRSNGIFCAYHQVAPRHDLLDRLGLSEKKAAHAMNAWQELAFGLPASFEPGWGLLALFTSGLATLLLAVYLFSWDSKNRRKWHSPYLALLAFFPYILAAIFLAS